MKAMHLRIPFDERFGWGRRRAACGQTWDGHRQRRDAPERALTENLSEVTCARCRHIIATILSAARGRSAAAVLQDDAVPQKDEGPGPRNP